MNAAKSKVPVTKSALVQRINRRLRRDDEALRKTRGAAEVSLGEYFIVDVNRNFVVQTDVDVEEFGRKLGALRAWEVLAGQGGV